MSATPGIRRKSVKSRVWRLVKLAVSALVFVFDCLWSCLCVVLRTRPPARWIVLYYHGVPDRYLKRFEKQMRLALRLATPIDLRRTGQVCRHHRSVSITFDDALDSFNTNAVPVLASLGIPAAVFVATDALGTKPAWVEPYSDERIMSDKQVAALPELIAVGSHTLTHPNLVRLSDQASIREIRESRRKLEQMIQRPVTLFSFPFGNFNDTLVRQCRQMGYERVFTTRPSCAAENNFVLGRVSADPWDWNIEFRLKMLGAYRWLASVARIRSVIRKRVCASGFAPAALRRAVLDRATSTTFRKTSG